MICHPVGESGGSGQSRSFTLKSDPISTCSISHSGFPNSIYQLSGHQREIRGLCISKGTLWGEKHKGLKGSDTVYPIPTQQRACFCGALEETT